MAALLFLLFALIGLGPVFCIRRGGLRDWTSWWLAPTVGFVLVSILSTLLIALQQPVPRWTLALAIGAPLASLALFAWTFRLDRSVQSPDAPEDGRWGGIALIAGTVLVVLPVQLGGWWFNHFRGNGWDSYNYVTMAEALIHEPLGFLRSSDTQTLVAKNDAYPNAQWLLEARWSTAAILGWLSCLTGMHPFAMEAHYGAMHLLLALGPAFVLSRRLGAGPRWAAVIAFVLATGFWAQFSLDLRSLSQLNSFPVLLLLLVVWPEAEGAFSWVDLLKPKRLLVLLIFCALAVLYIELITMTMLGLLLASALAWLSSRRVGLKGLAMQWVPAAIGLALAFAILPQLVHFYGSQVHSVVATTGRASWLYTQHYWLATAPLPGFWGLTHLDAGLRGWWTPFLGVFGVVLGSILSALLLAQLLAAVRPWTRASDQVLAGMIAAGLIQAAGMLVLNQSWASVKGVGYVAPLCLLGVAAWWAGRGKLDWPMWHARALFGTAVGLLVFTQAWSGILRTVVVVRRSDYLNYMFHLPNYAAQDLDLTPIEQALKHEPPSTRIGSMVGDIWLSRLVRLELGWDYKIVEPLGVVNVDDGRKIYPPLPEGKIDYWIWTQGSVPANVPADAIVAKTSTFVLTRSIPSIIDITNPNGLDEDPGSGKTLVWIGTEPATFRINSPGAGTGIMVARFIPGPSLTGTPERHLELVDETDKSMPVRQVTVNDSTVNLLFQVKPGINSIRLVCTDRPQVAELGNGDRRPLLVGILDPQMQFQP